MRTDSTPPASQIYTRNQRTHTLYRTQSFIIREIFLLFKILVLFIKFKKKKFIDLLEATTHLDFFVFSRGFILISILGLGLGLVLVFVLLFSYSVGVL